MHDHLLTLTAGGHLQQPFDDFVLLNLSICYVNPKLRFSKYGGMWKDMAFAIQANACWLERWR
jgi:hypothetical protein